MLYTKPGFFSQVLVSADSVATSQLRPLRLCHSVMMEIEFLVSMPVPDESPVAKPGLFDETSWQTPYPLSITQGTGAWLRGYPGRLLTTRKLSRTGFWESYCEQGTALDSPGLPALGVL